MAKLKEKQKLLIVAGAGGALTLLACGGVYYAKGLAHEERTQIQALRTQIGAADAKIAKIPNLERDVIVLRENLDERVAILPETQEVYDFVTKINEYAVQAGNFEIKALTDKTELALGSFGKLTWELDFEATIWQFMRFVNLFESDKRFLRIADFDIRTGAKGSKSAGIEGNVKHDITMKIETYVYHGQKKGAGGVSIAAYENKRSRFRSEIWDSRQLIRLATYDFRGPRGRRDILVDPRQKRGFSGQGTPIEVQERTVTDFIERIGQLREVYEQSVDPDRNFLERYQLESKLVQEVTSIQKEIAEIEIKELLTWQPCVQRWGSQVKGPFEEIRRLITDDEGGPADGLTKAELEETLDQMNSLRAQDDLVGLRAKYDTIASKLTFEQGDERYELGLQLTMLNEQATIAQEFSQIQLDVGGAVVVEDGRSVLMINGEAFEEGDYINDVLLLKRVGREQGEFVFRGFTVILSY